MGDPFAALSARNSSALGLIFFVWLLELRRPLGSVVVGAEYGSAGLRLQLGGRPAAGFAEVIETLPIQVIDPAVHRIVEEGSSRRRRLLDWGVFHVKHDFLVAWRRYQRALQQRNAALRSGVPWDLVTVWDSELSLSAEVLDRDRLAYSETLQGEFARWAGQLVGPRRVFRIPARLAGRRRTDGGSSRKSGA